MKIVAAFVMCLGLIASAAAQEAIAIAVEGWTQQEGRDGVVYYRCASPICAAGSVVSYKAQPHRTTISFADFEKHHRDLVKMNAGTGRIRDVRLSDLRERTVGGVRVLQAFREVDWADRSTTYTVEARLIGPDKSFSLVSDSPGRESAINNFEGFLRSLVQAAGVKPQ